MASDALVGALVGADAGTDVVVAMVVDAVVGVAVDNVIDTLDAVGTLLVGADVGAIVVRAGVVAAGAVGAFAFGYGLASKGMMTNLLASFYAKGKFIVGDTITVDGTKGQIVEIDNVSFNPFSLLTLQIMIGFRL